MDPVGEQIRGSVDFWWPVDLALRQRVASDVTVMTLWRVVGAASRPAAGHFPQIRERLDEVLDPPPV